MHNFITAWSRDALAFLIEFNFICIAPNYN